MIFSFSTTENFIPDETYIPLSPSLVFQHYSVRRDYLNHLKRSVMQMLIPAICGQQILHYTPIHESKLNVCCNEKIFKHYILILKVFKSM